MDVGGRSPLRLSPSAPVKPTVSRRTSRNRFATPAAHGHRREPRPDGGVILVTRAQPHRPRDREAGRGGGGARREHHPRGLAGRVAADTQQGRCLTGKLQHHVRHLHGVPERRGRRGAASAQAARLDAGHDPVGPHDDGSDARQPRRPGHRGQRPHHHGTTSCSGTAATPMAAGAGHVRPQMSLDPVLVYDAVEEDYVDFLCALNYTTALVYDVRAWVRRLDEDAPRPRRRSTTRRSSWASAAAPASAC